MNIDLMRNESRTKLGRFSGCSIAFLLVILLIPAPASAQGPFALVHRLLNPGTNSLSSGQHGRSVAMDGSLAVVTAFDYAIDVTNRGAAFVYDVTTGTSIYTLTNPNPVPVTYFGYSAAISATRVVIGAPLDRTDGQVAGSAFVYDLGSAGPLVSSVTLANPRPINSDFFGGSVSISGTLVVVGARNVNSGVTSTGSAYVFDLMSATPAIPMLTLTNPTPDHNDRFGTSVDISGARILVGAPGNDAGATNAGSAYVYDLTSATPSLPVVTLNNPHPSRSDQFGAAVAISGARVVVGAEWDDAWATNSGTAYVYDLAGATPTVPVATLHSPTPSAEDRFGQAVDISGSRVVVGQFIDHSSGTYAGTAYVYDMESSTPGEPVAKLRKIRPTDGDSFGASVAIDGTTIIVGAPFEDSVATGDGVTFVFGPRSTLSVAPASPGFARLSWTPPTSSDFLLQYTYKLIPANWITIRDGATNGMIIPATNTARFYQLVQP